MKVIVASGNPVKIEASRGAFAQFFPNESIECEGVKVPSGVSDQPMTEEETKLGAINRVRAAIKAKPNAAYWVGLEGGIAEDEHGMLAFAWMCVSDGEREGLGRTAGFYLPPKVAELVKQGVELGIADDQVFGKANSKQKNGAVGLLTGDLIVRETLYAPAVILALIPFGQADLYPQTTSGPS
ncbi:MAG: inosine/xanthosine triphosphatase [Bacteroidota bacterium]